MRKRISTAAAPLLVAACSAGGGIPGASTGDTAGVGGAMSPGTGGVPVGVGGAGTGGDVQVGAGGMPQESGGAGPSDGGPIAKGSGGSAPYGGYDPTVQFDWPESKPTAGSCKAGKYSGTFDGIYVSPVVAGFPVPIAGNVDLTLEESQDGEFYKVADGQISGLVYGFIPFSSGLTGTLDCTQAKLVDGFMPNGKYDFLGVDYPYEGPLDADYDKLTHAFVNGKWAVGEPTYHKGDPLPPHGGQGTWGANHVGP